MDVVNDESSSPLSTLTYRALQLCARVLKEEEEEEKEEDAQAALKQAIVYLASKCVAYRSLWPPLEWLCDLKNAMDHTLAASTKKRKQSMTPQDLHGQARNKLQQWVSSQLTPQYESGEQKEEEEEAKEEEEEEGMDKRSRERVQYQRVLSFAKRSALLVEPQLHGYDGPTSSLLHWAPEFWFDLQVFRHIQPTLMLPHHLDEQLNYT